MKNPTHQRIFDAQTRAEEAMLDLLGYAEDFSAGSSRNRRENLLRAARRYARAMDRLARIARS